MAGKEQPKPTVTPLVSGRIEKHKRTTGIMPRYMVRVRRLTLLTRSSA